MAHAQNPSSDEQIKILSTQADEMLNFSVPREYADVDIKDFLNQEDFDDFTDHSSWAVLKLPHFILLKGDNGKYLRTVMDGSNEFTANNNMDATVFEVVTLSDGAVAIRSTFNDMFLGNNRGYIQATFTADDLGEWTSRFWPVRMGRGTDTNLIGFRLYSSRLAQTRCFRWGEILGSSNMAANKRTGFELEEPVSQRQIYGVQYHMENAKIYDHEPLTSVTKDVKNWSVTPQKGALSFSHTESESHSWGSTDSWKVSGSVGMTVRIPFVKSTTVTTEAYYSGAYDWGEAQETAKEIASKLEVEIPPMSMVQATMIVQKGKLEVPFSYSQTDALYDGNSIPSNLQDGLFTGVNTYVTFHTIKRPLSAVA